MKIYEIGENEQIEIVAKKDDASVEYTLPIIMNEKNILFIEPIMHGGMVVNFQADDVKTDVIYVGEDEKPLVWRNVIIKHVTYNGRKFHIIYSDKDGLKLNRRENFRQYLGVKGSLQIDLTREVNDVVVKDISESGVAFVSDNKLLHMDDIGAFHLSFQDRDNRLSVQLEGSVVREVDLEDGRRLFGAKVKHSNVNLYEYVAVKQKKDIAKRRLK